MVSGELGDAEDIRGAEEQGFTEKPGDAEDKGGAEEQGLTEKPGDAEDPLEAVGQSG